MDRNKMIRMESLRTHTLFGAGHEQPHEPGDTYEIEESFVDTLIGQGMARRAAPAKKPAETKSPAAVEVRPGVFVAPESSSIFGTRPSKSSATAIAKPSTTVAPPDKA
jgi:hypothetical protein